MNVILLIPLILSSVTLVKGTRVKCSQLTAITPAICTTYWTMVGATLDDDHSNIATSDRLSCLRAVSTKCDVTFNINPADLNLFNRMVRIIITHTDGKTYNMYTYADTARDMLGYVADD